MEEKDKTKMLCSLFNRDKITVEEFRKRMGRIKRSKNVDVQKLHDLDWPTFLDKKHQGIIFLEVIKNEPGLIEFLLRNEAQHTRRYAFVTILLQILRAVLWVIWFLAIATWTGGPL